MGKRRNRNRNRRYKGQYLKQFRSQSISQAFHDETERERYKEEQKAHLKNIAELKLDLLSRTVMVGSVLPLGQEKNKVALRNFMERQYGPVQKVGIVNKKRGGKFPQGRVTFNYKTDAEQLFDGVSLTEASKNRLQVKILCPSVGYKGSITVRPCSEYKGMVKEDLNTDSAIQVNTEDYLSLGHWFPKGADACANLPGYEDNNIGMDQNGTFVEENTTKVNPILLIDMEKAVIELDVTHCMQRVKVEIPSLEELFEQVSGSKK